MFPLLQGSARSRTSTLDSLTPSPNRLVSFPPATPPTTISSNSQSPLLSFPSAHIVRGTKQESRDVPSAAHTRSHVQVSEKPGTKLNLTDPPPHHPRPPPTLPDIPSARHCFCFVSMSFEKKRGVWGRFFFFTCETRVGPVSEVVPAVTPCCSLLYGSVSPSSSCFLPRLLSPLSGAVKPEVGHAYLCGDS